MLIFLNFRGIFYIFKGLEYIRLFTRIQNYIGRIKVKSTIVDHSS